MKTFSKPAFQPIATLIMQIGGFLLSLVLTLYLGITLYFGAEMLFLAEEIGRIIFCGSLTFMGVIAIDVIERKFNKE